MCALGWEAVFGNDVDFWKIFGWFFDIWKCRNNLKISILILVRNLGTHPIDIFSAAVIVASANCLCDGLMSCWVVFNEWFPIIFYGIYTVFVGISIEISLISCDSLEI
jgi:hypothetical protein